MDLRRGRRARAGAARNRRPTLVWFALSAAKSRLAGFSRGRPPCRWKLLAGPFRIPKLLWREELVRGSAHAKRRTVNGKRERIR
jgi:hypothetical protein